MTQPFHDAMFSRFTVLLPTQCVVECSGSGDKTAAVQEWAAKLNHDFDLDDVREELREYGVWTEEELADDDANWERLIWCAACNIQDSTDSI